MLRRFFLWKKFELASYPDFGNFTDVYMFKITTTSWVFFFSDFENNHFGHPLSLLVQQISGLRSRWCFFGGGRCHYEAMMM